MVTFALDFVAPAIQQYTLAIQERFDIQSLYVFGSTITGTATKWSDIDLLILSPDFEDRLEARLDLMRLRRGIDDRIEPHPLLLEDFNEHHALAAEAMHNGVQISLHMPEDREETVNNQLKTAN